MFEIWLIFRYHHTFFSRRCLFDVWIQFSCGFGWWGSHIWLLMIWCHMIFQPTVHLMSYWGIFPFRLRFIDLHGVAWSSSLMICMSSWWSIVILSWSLSGVSLGPFSQAHTFRYLDVIMLLFLGDILLVFGLIQLWMRMTGITPLMMDDSMLSDFSIYYTSNVIPEHIFPFG